MKGASPTPPSSSGRGARSAPMLMRRSTSALSLLWSSGSSSAGLSSGGLSPRSSHSGSSL